MALNPSFTQTMANHQSNMSYERTMVLVIYIINITATCMISVDFLFSCRVMNLMIGYHDRANALICTYKLYIYIYIIFYILLYNSI